jgi:predicted secreted protein
VRQVLVARLADSVNRAMQRAIEPGTARVVVSVSGTIQLQ